MEHTVQLYIVRHGAPPGEAPRVGAPLHVVATRHDELREEARKAIEARGLRVRALSFVPGGGLVAYGAERP